MNKDIAGDAAVVKHEQRVVHDAQHVNLKDEEIKKVWDNQMLQELDTRHKVKLNHLNNQDYVNRQIEEKRDNKIIKE